MKYATSHVDVFVTEVLKTATSKEELKTRLFSSLFRNAYYLIASAVISSIGGTVFWIMAARFYSPADVGLAGSLISVIVLISTFSNLGMGFGLIRFLPTAENRANEMINSCLTIGVLASAGIAVIFLAGLSLWSRELMFIRESPLYVATFILLAIVWTLVVLVEQVFVAKRAAKYTLGQRMVAAVVRLPLPVAFAGYFGVGAFGIFVSAGLAMGGALLLALFWFLPRAEKGFLVVAPLVSRDVVGKIVGYSLGNSSYLKDILLSDRYISDELIDLSGNILLIEKISEGKVDEAINELNSHIDINILTIENFLPKNKDIKQNKIANYIFQRVAKYRKKFPRKKSDETIEKKVDEILDRTVDNLEAQ